MNSRTPVVSGSWRLGEFFPTFRPMIVAGVWVLLLLAESALAGPMRVIPSSGPFVGGNTVVITNGTYGTITNITVGGVAATIQDSATTWARITMPAVGSAGVKDVVVQSSDSGDTTLANVYTVNPAGVIGSWSGDWSRWEQVVGLPTGCTYLTGAVYSNALYAIGGIDSGYRTNVLRYDGTCWTEVAGLPTARIEAEAAVWNGHLYTVAGSTGSQSTNVYRFDGTSWTEVAGIPVQQRWHAVAVYSNQLYCVGGLQMTNVYVYNGTTWTAVAGLPGSGLGTHRCAVLGGYLYAFGGSDGTGYTDKAYRFNGTSWTTASNMPVAMQCFGADVLDGRIYAVGGISSTWLTNMWAFNETNWAISVGLPESRSYMPAVTLDGSLYVIGGTKPGYTIATNVFRCPARISTSGVVPQSGSSLGGYEVTILGENLGNGSDITNVTLCGANVASIDSQSATQVVVTAGGTGGAVTGAVRVFSTSYGETIKTNAFEYTYISAPGILVFGPSFDYVLVGMHVTNIFTVTNTGDATLTISGWTNDGVGAANFELIDPPSTVDIGTASNFPVVFTSGAVGSFSPTCYTVNNSPNPNYGFALSGSAYQLSVDVGPGAGGNTITITNGSFGTITNVTVGGAVATIEESGDNWVTITLPAHAAGTVDIVVQSAGGGETTLPSAYTYNPVGEIYDNIPIGWSEVAGLPLARRMAAAGTLNGALYSVGGYDGVNKQTNVFRFDGTSWTEVAGLPAARCGQAAGTLDTALYAFGGSDSSWMPLTNTYRFDGTHWTEVAGLLDARSEPAAATLNDRLYSVGGSGGYTPFEFDGTNWTAVSDLPTFRLRMGAGALNDKLFAVGGDGGSGTPVTNTYCYDGATWTEVAGLPQPKRSFGAGVLNGFLYAVGGWDGSSSYTTNMFRFDGTNWTMVCGMPVGRSDVSAAVFKDRLYVLGGMDYSPGDAKTNVYCYSEVASLGLSPASGSITGGYPVVIGGTNLSSGDLADVTNVTICGAQAMVTDVAGSTQIIVTAGAHAAGVGDVVVYSISHGMTIKPNIFTYTGPDLSVLGTNGAVIASGAAADRTNGSDYGLVLASISWTNTFSIANDGNQTLNISGVATSGVDAAQFTVVDWPAQVDAATASNLVIAFQASVGSYAATISLANDSLVTPYLLNLAGSVYQLSPNIGPYAGGNNITITNSHFGAITNVLVGGVAATIEDSGDNWVTITVPAAGSAGVKDIVIQTSDNGDTTLANAYTVNPPGGILSVLPASGLDLGGYSVVISGSNLCDGADATNVTLCGFNVSEITGMSATQIVVTAGAASGAVTGDVRVFSTSYGETVESNAFEYIKSAAGILVSGPAFDYTRVGRAATNIFTVTNTGTATLTISAWTNDGAGKDEFAVIDPPTSVSPGTASNFPVVFTPAAIGTFNPTCYTVNNSPSPNYSFGLYGKVYQLSANAGPYVGGNTVTITNDSFGTITNVLVGGVAATIQDSGENWVRITIPAIGSAGVKDVVIQTSDNGDTILPGAYTYNPQGQIGGVHDDWSRWEEIVGLPEARAEGGSAVFDGAIYYVGGGDGGYVDSVFSFDGTNWTTVASLPTPRGSGVAAAALEDALYAMGGFDGNVATNVYRFDGTSWTAIEGLPDPGTYWGGAETLGGFVYYMGGYHYIGNYYRTNTYAYAGSGSWTEVAGMPAGRSGFASGVLNGYIYIAGGEDFGGAYSDVYRFDGSMWEAAPAMPGVRAGCKGAVLNGDWYLLGGGDGNEAITTAWKFDGSEWTESPGLPFANYNHTMAALGGRIYCMGGWDPNTWNPMTNVYAYPGQSLFAGVEPMGGSYTGGYQVVITGTDLCDGGDVTNVTLCGVSVASIDGQSATQIVVTAAAGTHGLGDVRVFSTSFGETVKADAFTYQSPVFSLRGKGGAEIASGDAASGIKGSDFQYRTTNGASVRTFSIVNTGDAALNISGWTTNGAGAAAFAVDGVPSVVVAGATSTFDVVFQPSAFIAYAAQVQFDSDAVASPFVLNLAGRGCNVDPVIGPYMGGTTVTITTGALGDGSDITNVTVGGVEAVIVDQGADWVSITIPVVGSSGAKDIVVQSTSLGTLTFADAYTVRPAGVIGGIGPATWVPNSGLDSRVEALAINPLNGRIVAGGSFTGCMEWDGSEWNALGDLDDEVYALTVNTNNGHLVAGGYFSGYCAEWDGSEWTYLEGLDDEVYALAINPENGHIVAGGYWSGVMEWDGEEWNSLGDLDDEVYALTVNPETGHLVAGGYFSGYCAEWDGSEWIPLEGLDDEVDALTFNPENGHLVAGGYFSGYCAEWDGSEWTTLGELNYSVLALAVNPENGRIVAGGRFSEYCAEWDGSDWVALGELDYRVYALTVNTNNGRLIAGGSFEGNCAEWRGLPVSGVDPSSGSFGGGYPVVIVGSNLCDGADVTDVTLCGVSVDSIESQSATQIVVVAAPGPVGLGDVRVFSTSFGETVKSNGFTYTAAALNIVGVNGEAIASGEAASNAKGSEMMVGFGCTNITTLMLTNCGSETLVFSGAVTSGVNPEAFVVLTYPEQLAVGEAGDLTIACQGDAVGTYAAALTFTFNGTNSPYVLNLKGLVYQTSADSGPSAGGNLLTITYAASGSGDITNVLVDGVAAVIDGQSDGWVRIVMPAHAIGAVSLVVQSATLNVVLNNVYTYNPAGWIGGPRVNAWAEVAGLPVDRGGVGGAQVGNELYVVGGRNNSGVFYSTNVYRFDGGDWSAVAGLPVACSYVTCAAWDGALYALGGMDGVMGYRTNVLKYSGGAWTEVAGLPQPSIQGGADVLNDRLYYFGGETNVYAYDGTNWTETAGLPVALNNVGMVAYNGFLYAVGGQTSVGGNFTTNVYRFDGTNWTEVAGLPGERRGVNCVVTNGALLVIGGHDGSSGTTNVFRYDGTSWTTLPGGYPVGIYESSCFGFINDKVYGVAGCYLTNVYCFPVTDSGVSPTNGDSGGGFEVVIVGGDLGDGSDITNVTLCGASVASIDSQSSTQVVVTTAMGSAGLGDVRVYSVSFGETVKSNAFTYESVDYTLTIESTYGFGTPAVGVYTNPIGTELTISMANPEAADTTQYICGGWALAGNEPASGTETQVVMTVTNDATLTWLWKTNYWLATAAGPNGSVNVGDGWQAFGATTQLTATADQYYHFTSWSGDISLSDISSNPVALLVDAPKSVTANFAENMTTSSPTPVPEKWLAEFGLTGFEEDVNADPDHDGQVTWEEYLAAETDPTNAASYFRADVSMGYGTNYTELVDEGFTTRVYEVVGLLIQWPSISGRVYDVESALDVMGEDWIPTEWTNQVATPPVNTVTNSSWMSNGVQFFRAKARME